MGTRDMLSEAQQRVIDHGVAGLGNAVQLLYYTPDVPSSATAAERALLEAVAAASDRIHLAVLADQWDAAREAEVGIARTPAIAVKGARDHGIRYYGTPDGYELETFLAVIRAVSEDRSGLSAASCAAIRSLADPLHLDVLVAPT
jgi:alkyl hydroperoxide reductase subunit AhpF